MNEVNISKTMGIQEWVLVMALSVIWGGSFFFIGVAVKSLPPLTLVFLRVALAAVVLNLGAAVSYSFAGIYGRRFRRLGIHPVVTAIGQVSASSIMLSPLALAVDHPWLLPFPNASVVDCKF
jgi:drug/metabolite transporter (DMT)-like permease